MRFYFCIFTHVVRRGEASQTGGNFRGVRELNA